jgi:hypothetical protein
MAEVGIATKVSDEVGINLGYLVLGCRDGSDAVKAKSPS